MQNAASMNSISIWLPYQEEHRLGVRHHPYTIVSAIRHSGVDGAGHFRALGRSAMGWVQFDDLKEAVVLDSHAPHTTEWVIIWLIRENAVDFSLWRGSLLGTDIFPRQLQEEMFEEYPQALLDRLRCHCSICGKLVIDHDGLRKRIKLRHPEHRGVTDRDLATQVQIQRSALPYHACGARPSLNHRPLEIKAWLNGACSLLSATIEWFRFHQAPTLFLGAWLLMRVRQVAASHDLGMFLTDN